MEEDDKPTVVLDFNAIKDQLNKEEELTDQHALDSLFANEFQDIEPLEQEKTEEEIKQNIYLFDYQSEYFKKTLPMYLNNKHMHLIESLEELNNSLSTDPKAIVLFYYNNSPKVVNQLTHQIKNKFKQAKTVIIAKNLAAEKAQAHSKSKYGAHSYLNDPFNLNELYQTINYLEDS